MVVVAGWGKKAEGIRERLLVFLYTLLPSQILRVDDNVSVQSESLL